MKDSGLRMWVLAWLGLIIGHLGGGHRGEGA
jgi:hypothetical protein